MKALFARAGSASGAMTTLNWTPWSRRVCADMVTVTPVLRCTYVNDDVESDVPTSTSMPLRRNIRFGSEVSACS